MKLNWNDLLTYSVLKEAKIIAGKSGLHRTIKSISVYDCKKQDDFIADEKEVLYISMLKQFENSPEKLLTWIEDLNFKKSSGICTMEDSVFLLSDDIINKCNNMSFPIVSINKDISYAEIIKSVSILLYFNNIHATNSTYINKIINNNLSSDQIIKLLHKINPSISKYVQAINIHGKLKYKLNFNSLNVIISNSKDCTYIKLESSHLFILSCNCKGKIKTFLDSIISQLKSMFEVIHIGIGTVQTKSEFDKSLRNSLNALKIAESMNLNSYTYNSLDDISIFINMQNNNDMLDFYNNFLQEIYNYDPSADINLLPCIRTFVENGGNYKNTAKSLFIHESTARYKINKIKTALKMEDNTVKFYEILSIFVVFEKLINNVE